MLLVGQGVGQLMHQRFALIVGVAGGIEDEQPLLPVIVEGGGLLSQQVDLFTGQVEFLRDQAKHLQGQLFGVDFFLAGPALGVLLQIAPEAVLAEDLRRNFVADGPAGDLRKSEDHLVHLREERGGGLRQGGRSGEQDGEQQTSGHQTPPA